MAQRKPFVELGSNAIKELPGIDIKEKEIR